jgi:hypothetical protein
MKRLLPLATPLAFGLFFSAPAGAQLLGGKGDAIFSGERLFGVRGEHWVEHRPAPQGTLTATDTIIAFGFATVHVPYNIPRLAFDYMVIDKLSVGGSLGFSLSNVETNDNGQAVPLTAFLLAPRVGYLHMFGRVAGIWPRGGFVYHSASADLQYKESDFALNLECMFPIVMAGHFGTEIGVTFDQSLTGKRDPENGVAYDISYRSIALQVGLFGWI